MLQISTGKFFTGEAYETLRRALFFTNYRMFCQEERIDTKVGTIQPVDGAHGLSALTCEIIERIQKQPGGPYSGEVIATMSDTLVNDFAAIISFALNITCTPDIDLARRLTTSERPSLGADLVPQKYVARIFDRVVDWRPGDAEILAQFVDDLVALERRSYEGAMRAIRRYVTGAHRIPDDMNLAYSLFVMSMESLAQNFDGFVPEWKDYDQKKRRGIDEALAGANEEVAAAVRATVLDNEHVAISSRFRAFVLANVQPGFFREEAGKTAGAISRPDLSAALRQAYTIRSSYVHHLQEIPDLITGIDGFHEMIHVADRPTLTFAGLSRLARHVITTFVSRAPRTETEQFDWWHHLPGKLNMQMAAQYWISDPRGFNKDTTLQYLQGFVGQQVERLSGASAILSDMRPVLAEIEKLLPGLAKPCQRLPMLALYFLFNAMAIDAERTAGYPGFLEPYKEELDTPSSISLAAHLLVGQTPDWALADLESLYDQYFRERHHAGTFNLGRLLEAAFALTLAERNRAAGDADRARELVSSAVEAHPQHAGLRGFEASAGADPMPAIDWQVILLPPRAPADPPADQGPATPSPEPSPNPEKKR